jgi:Ricin-type beta-trefoil lectin domain-like
MKNTGIALALTFVGLVGCSAEGDGANIDDEAGTSQLALVNNKTNFLRNLSTQRCLDGNSSGDVYTSGCYWATYQGWKVTAKQFGFELKNIQTGRCLDSNTSGDVYGNGCNGGSYQQWAEEWVGGTIRLKNVATNRYLDSNTSGDVYTLPYNGGNFQRWENFYNP